MMTYNIPVPFTLPIVLDALHDHEGQRDVETIRGGTQVNLRDCRYKVVMDTLDLLAGAIDLGDAMRFGGLWTSRMSKGGYHVKHQHPDGVLSGVYYVQVGQGGELEIGDEVVVPKRGLLVLFSSAVPHGTRPYKGDLPRLTMAFDLVKA